MADILDLTEAEVLDLIQREKEKGQNEKESEEV